jgi:metal-responsive CopG/Arc/MetJ family transcriptional regulator
MLYTVSTIRKGAFMKESETILTALRIPRTTIERVDKVSDGNRSEFIRQAIDEKLARVKEQEC